MEAYRTAYVYVRNTFAGTLKETDSGYSFIYDAEYIAKANSTAVSLFALKPSMVGIQLV